VLINNIYNFNISYTGHVQGTVKKYKSYEKPTHSVMKNLKLNA